MDRRLPLGVCRIGTSGNAASPDARRLPIFGREAGIRLPAALSPNPRARIVVGSSTASDGTRVFMLPRPIRTGIANPEDTGAVLHPVRPTGR